MTQAPTAAFTLPELQQVLSQARYGAVVVEPDGMRVLYANPTAAELISQPASDLVGARFPDLVRPTQAGDAEATLNALLRGGVVNYKAKWQFGAPNAFRDVWVWARAVDTAGRMVIVLVLVPPEVGTAVLMTAPLLPGDHLALGITDTQWAIARVTADIRPLLGCLPIELRTHSLFGLLHPDDAVPTLQAVREWKGMDDSLLTVVRARHADGSWRPLQMLLVPLSEDDPPILAFLLTEANGAAPAHQPSERISQLERHLLRIAMEVQAADVAGQVSALPSVDRFPALRDLSDRQWEVLTRLIAGERVPGIAARMHLSQSTVRNHLAAIFQRFAVHSQSELVELLRVP